MRTYFVSFTINRLNCLPIHCNTDCTPNDGKPISCMDDIRRVEGLIKQKLSLPDDETVIVTNFRKFDEL